MMKLYALIVLLSIASLGLTVPINDSSNVCAQSCKSDPNFIRYDSGYTYLYDYDFQTANDINRIETDLLSGKAVVEITVHRVCDLSLQLRNVRINGTSNWTQLSQQLESYPIMFGYSDGEIVGVCPSVEDTVWAVNVKKSIISALQIRALQSNSDIVRETMIFGNCKSNARLYENFDSKTRITETEITKHIYLCTQNWSSYDFIPLTNCQFIVSDKILNKISCAQYLVEYEFADIKSRAELKFKQKIFGNFVNSTENYGKQELTLSDQAFSKYKESHALELMSDICADVTDNNVSGKSLRTLSELLSPIKHNSTAADQLRQTMQSENICSSAKSGSDLNANSFDPTLYISELYNLTDDKMNDILLAFQSGNLTSQQILLFSSQVFDYCSIITENCSQIPLNIEIKNAFIKQLQRETKVINKIVIIKALSNMKFESNSEITRVLSVLIKDRQMEDETCIASMFGIKSYDPSEETVKMLLEIITDQTESADVRVAAFKTIRRQTITVYLDAIKLVCEESDSSFGDYIRSQFGKYKSICKHKAGNSASNFESLIMDLFKSRYFEGYHRGFSIEVDVVYPKLYAIPGTLHIKASYYAFVDRSTIIEIEVRQKGFENYIKQIIGRNANNLPQFYKELIELISSANKVDSKEEMFAQIFVNIMGKNVLAFDTRSISYSESQSVFDIIRHYIDMLTRNSPINGSFGTMFLHEKMVIPTILGQSLIREVNGTILAALKANLKYNSSDFDLQLKPSLAIEISKGKHLNGYYSQLDRRSSSALFFNPIIDVNVKNLSRNNNLRFNMNLNLKVFQINTRIKVSVNNSDTDRQNGNIIVEYRSELNENIHKSKDLEQLKTEITIDRNARTEPTLWLNISIANSGALLERLPYFESIKRIDIYLSSPADNAYQTTINTPLKTYILSSNLSAEQSFFRGERLPSKVLKISLDNRDNSTERQIIGTIVFVNGITSVVFSAEYYLIGSNGQISAQQIKVELLYGKLFWVPTNPPFIADIEVRSTQFWPLNVRFLYSLAMVSNTSGEYDTETGFMTTRNLITTDDELLIEWNRYLERYPRFHYKRQFEFKSEYSDEMLLNYDSVENVSLIITPLDIDYEIINSLNGANIFSRLLSFKISTVKRDKTGRHEHSDYSGGIELFLPYWDLTSGSLNVSANYSGRDMVYRQKWYMNEDKFNNSQTEASVYYQWQSGRYVRISANLNLSKSEGKYENEVRMENRIEFEKWDQIERKVLRGFFSNQQIGRTSIAQMNYETNDNQFVRTKTVHTPNSWTGVGYEKTYDIAIQSPGLLVMNISGSDKLMRTMDWLYGEGRYGKAERLYEYRWRDGRQESLKLLTQMWLQQPREEVKETVKSETNSTQWPSFNFTVYYWLKYKRLFSSGVYDHTFALRWAESVDDYGDVDDADYVKVRYYLFYYSEHDSDTYEQNVLRLLSVPLNLEHRFEFSRRKKGDKYSVELTARDTRTYLPEQRLSITTETRDRNFTSVFDIELHCPVTKSSHRTNVTIRVDTDRNYLKQLIIKSKTLNKKTNETYVIDIDKSEDKEEVILVRFPKFNASLTEVLVDNEYRITSEISGGEESAPFRHASRAVHNRETGKLAISLNMSGFGDSFDTVDNEIETTKIGRIIEADVDYEPKKSAVIAVRSQPYWHRSAMTFENWSSLAFNSNTTKEDNNILNINFEL